MYAALRSELRKLLTIRSTFVLAAICLAINLLIAFYVYGYKAAPETADGANVLAGSTLAVINLLNLPLLLIGVLAATHEYRYNTIIYTLTAVRKRWQTVLAKVLSLALVALVITALNILLAPVLTRYGLTLNNNILVVQDFPLGEILLRGVFYGVASILYGLAIGLLIRKQVGGIVTVLLFPSLIEVILGLLLRGNVKYLPFRALDQALSSSGGTATAQMLSSNQATLVATGYIVVGLGLATWLLYRRDVN